MRTVDLDSVRPLVGEFSLTVNGIPKTFRVFKPTLWQKLVHRKELDQVIKNLKKLESADGKTVKQPDYDTEVARWMHREVEIFVPEFTKEDAEWMVEEQHAVAIDIIFERDRHVNEDGPVEKKTKKRESLIV